jgi:hypothetical protein
LFPATSAHLGDNLVYVIRRVVGSLIRAASAAAASCRVT